MRVEIAPDALTDQGGWTLLDRIVDALYDEDHVHDERHLWEIDDLGALLDSPWLQPPEHRSSRVIREIAERSYLALATVPKGRRAHTRRVVVTLTPRSVTRGLCLDPRKTLDVLRAPLRVVVENKRSDGAFIEAMAHAFGHRDLRVALTRGWCEFVHAGGSGEIFKRVEECLDGGALPERVCVVTDGDRLTPRVAVDPRADALRNRCKARSVECFILHKRDSENYLPVAVLSLADHGEKLTAFARLTQVQRDHFDMKDGFTLKRPADDPAYDGLFADLEPRRRDALAGGFGKHIGDLFESKREHLRRDDVEKTCSTCPDELPALLDALESML